jgi:cell pole-organizing protein PopZ
MEDILASIRRILNEGESEVAEAPAEQAPAAAAPEPAVAAAPVAAPSVAAPVSAIVTPTAPPAPQPAPQAAVPPPPVVEPVVAAAPEPVPERVIVAPAPPEVTKGPQNASVEPKKTVEAAEVFILEPTMMVTENAAAADATAAPIASSETVSAASQSVGALKKALAERNAQVYRLGNVSLEDLVRDEVRPMLKDWLDTHLPAIVERLVRAEIERVVAREIL